MRKWSRTPSCSRAPPPPSARSRTNRCRWWTPAFPACCRSSIKHCVEQAVKTGLGLAAEINLVSIFDRKNYFYADLPRGLSDPQHDAAGRRSSGILTIDLPDGSTRDIGITQAPSRAGCGQEPPRSSIATQTYVDLNRAGVALMEIVSEPDLRSRPKKLRLFMQESCARSCAISARATATWRKARCAATATCLCVKPGTPYGTRCEITNVNSIRFRHAGDRIRGAAPDRGD